MKTIIAGSRSANNPEDLERAVADCGWQVTSVVSGHCPDGADKLGEDWAKENCVMCKTFPADWTKHGKSAGMIRNAEMAKFGEALIALWDGKSPGTKNMIENARKRKLKIHIEKPTPLPGLYIAVSRHVDKILHRGRDNEFIHAVYDQVQAALRERKWGVLKTNSVVIAAAFGFDDKSYPPDNHYDPVIMCQALWDTTHIMAFWAGGPNFEQVLEASIRMQKKKKFFMCDTDNLTVTRVRHDK